VTAVAVGEHYSAALKNDGSVVVWGDQLGDNSKGLTNVPVAAQSGVIAIAAGWHHMVALKNDGSVIAWGANFSGQVTGTPTTNAPYSAIASPVILAGQPLSGVTAISASYRTSLALRGNGWDLGAPLALRHSGNQMLVSWTTNATGFTLQSTQTLTPPGPWLDVTNPPAVTGGQFIVTNPVSGDSQFFRLKKP